MGYTLHKTAVANETLGVVINEGVAGAVKLRGQSSLCDSHALGVGQWRFLRLVYSRAQGGLGYASVAGESFAGPQYLGHNRIGEAVSRAALSRAHLRARNGHEQASSVLPDYV